MEASSGRLKYKCKVVLLGEQSVGKSSIALRFVYHQFVENHAPTIGAAFLTKSLSMNDFSVKFEIWDTAGQERFHCIAPMYYRNSQAAIVVYDITDSKTFFQAKVWIKELRQQADPNVVIILVGNKADLDDKRSVQQKEAFGYAKEQSIYYLETSAKRDMNINEVFYEIGKRYPKKRRSTSADIKQPEPMKKQTCCSTS